MAPTPGRASKARSKLAEPLPINDNPVSHAYGSVEVMKIAEASEIPKMTVPDGISLTEAFAAQSEGRPYRPDLLKHVSPEPETHKSPSKRKPAARKAKSARKAPPVTADDDDIEDDPVDDEHVPPPTIPDTDVTQRPPTRGSAANEGTVVDSVAHYEPPLRPLRRSAAAGAPPPPPPSHRRDTPLSDEELRRLAEPWNITVFFRTLPRYLGRLIADIPFKTLAKYALLLLLPILLASFIFSNAPLSERMAAHRARMIKGVRLIAGLPEYEQPPSGVEKDWIFFKHERMFRTEELPDYNVPELQWAINIGFLERIERLEKKTENFTETLQSLQDLLPKSLVVETVNGELTVPESFWLALRSKLQGDESMWQAFLSANQRSLEIFGARVVTDQLNHAASEETIISKAMFQDLIKQNNEWLMNRYQQDLRNAALGIIEDSKTVANDVTNDLLAKHSGTRQPGDDPMLLAKSNLVYNIMDEMQSVNHFSRGLGARIDPRFTSPTIRVRQTSFMASLWAAVFNPPHPPHVALEKWHEGKECWCAPGSTDRGKAQIAILTTAKIYPEEIVIEHVPARGTLEIAAAPRDVEVWIEALDEEHAHRINDTIAQHVPSWHWQACGPSPGRNFVCVGWGKYDIHRDNWVQRFPMAVQAQEHGIASDHFVVRAATNWGADHTCLYRVRLNGETA